MNNIFSFFLILFSSSLIAQDITIEGYILDETHNTPLSAVSLKVFPQNTQQLIAHTLTDKNGFFEAKVSYHPSLDIYSTKYLYKTQKTQTVVKKEGKDTKVFLKIKMSPNAESLSTNPRFEIDISDYEKGSFTSVNPELNRYVESYGIDSKKINPSTNPDGISIPEAISTQNPYTQVTNATRLTANNYNNAWERENIKYERIPSNYQAPVVQDKVYEEFVEKNYSHKILPDDYNVGSSVIPTPLYGESTVAVANLGGNAKSIPPNYVGYRAEFLTSFEPLSSNHKIFRQHGNIYFDRKVNGMFSYYLGDFSDKTIASNFLKEVVLPIYPSATLVYFEKGILHTIKTSKEGRQLPTTPPK